MTKVTFDTSNFKRDALRTYAETHGLSVGELVDARMSDVIVKYVSDAQCVQLPALSSLLDLDDKTKILDLLKSVDWNFSDADTGYLTHDIHPYPAKFIPQIPANLIQALSLPGELIWDPFGGSGTTALEALLMDRRCLSTDANPLGEIIGQCKCLTLDQKDIHELELFQNWMRELVKNPSQCSHLEKTIPTIPNINKWFHHNAVQELGVIRYTIDSMSERARIVSQVALARTVFKVSNQEGETRYTSKPKDIEQGTTFQRFLGDFNIVLSKVISMSYVLSNRKGKFDTLDLRLPIEETYSEIQNSVDLIVTSPPYANATDYHLYHRFRMFWLGFDPVEFGAKEIGSHLRHQRENTGFDDYMSEMQHALRNCLLALKPGRYAAFVLGDSVFNKETYDTAEAYRAAGENIGFEFVGVVERQLPADRRSFAKVARRATGEKILIFRKTPQTMTATLCPAPYKLWPYEKELLLREVRVLTGTDPESTVDRQLSVTSGSYIIDAMRKLTFIHDITYPDGSSEPTWQKLVENGDVKEHVSTRKESKYLTHGIHDYKGKFYPQLCRSLLMISEVPTSGVVFDPFMGSGTTMLEAYLNGFQPLGTDMNPLAVRIARAKTEILQMNSDRVLDTFNTICNRVLTARPTNTRALLDKYPSNVATEIASWFPDPVIAKVGIIVEEIYRIPDERLRNSLSIILSNLVRKVSHQEPKDLRIRRRKEPLEDAPVIEMFVDGVQSLMDKLRSFYGVIQYSPARFHEPRLIHGDIRDMRVLSENGVGANQVDAIITSPPYATALPYVDINRLSLLLLEGMDSRHRNEIEGKIIGTREIRKRQRDAIEERIANNDFASILSESAKRVVTQLYEVNRLANVGFRRRNMASLLYSYYESMTEVFSNCNHVVKGGGSIFIVIGDNVTSSEGVTFDIPTTSVLREMGENLGWQLEDEISITVTKDNLIHMNRSIGQNQILWFRK